MTPIHITLHGCDDSTHTDWTPPDLGIPDDTIGRLLQHLADTINASSYYGCQPSMTIGEEP